MRIGVAVAALGFLCRPLCAGDAPPVNDWSVETVVVTAEAPGPAFWHLTKGNSEVWVLGTLAPLPEDLSWNSTRLGALLDGAHALLMPARASVGLFEGSWFLLTNRDLLSMPDGQKLEDTLSPDLKARFVAARTALHKDADHYEDDAPVVAGLVLERDFNNAHDFSTDEPADTAKRLARAKHVPVREIADYDAMPLAKQLLSLGPEASRRCLANAVEDVETRAIHAMPAAKAWAVGDIKTVEAHYSVSRFDGCLSQTSDYAKLDQRGVADTLAAIKDALSRPGKAVVLIDIGELLRNAGVVEQLRAAGITVEGP